MTLVYYLLCTDQLSNDNECSHTSVMVCVILVPKSKSPRGAGGCPEKDSGVYRSIRPVDYARQLLGRYLESTLVALVAEGVEPYPERVDG